MDRPLRLLTLVVCSLAVLYFVATTASWPFMGDSGYIHYVVFLTQHGFAPFRDIVEINTPGAYLTEHIAMSVFGSGALGWRLFDLTLLAITFLSYIRLLRGAGLAPAILAGTLFLAIHAQDGVMMSGERDLVAAVLAIAAIALLLPPNTSNHARTSLRSLLRPFAAGLLLSWSAAIKPPNLLLLLFVLGWLLIGRGRERRLRESLAMIAGAILPWLACLVYLLRYRALEAYWTNLHGIEAFHVSLDRKPLAFLLPHAFSPILWLFLLAVPLAVLHARSHLPRTGVLLSLAAFAALLSYTVQGKGFSYQRYPFLIFLVPLIAFCLAKPLPGLAWLNIVRSCAWLAALGILCVMVHKASTYAHTDPDRALVADMQTLGIAAASGSVQCLDTAGSCIQTLYKQRLVQSTGFLYDCYFEDGQNATVQKLRRRFATALAQTRPLWIIQTNSSCFERPRTFNKYPDWTAFNSSLDANYKLVLERQPTQSQHYWSRSQLPFAYRIYRRK